VGAPPEIELISRYNLLCLDGPADDVASFEDTNAIPCLGKIRTGDKAVVTGSNRDDIVVHRQEKGR